MLNEKYRLATWLCLTAYFNFMMVPYQTALASNQPKLLEEGLLVATKTVIPKRPESILPKKALKSLSGENLNFDDSRGVDRPSSRSWDFNLFDGLGKEILLVIFSFLVGLSTGEEQFAKVPHYKTPSHQRDKRIAKLVYIIGDVLGIAMCVFVCCCLCCKFCCWNRNRQGNELELIELSPIEGG